VDGYVIERGAEPSQNVLATTPVLKIVDPETLWIKAKIDERISAQVKPSQKATIILRSQPGKRYKGVVKKINAMTDSVTLERKINVAFETLPRPFFINEQALVFIDVRQYDNVTTVPLTVVVQKGGKTGMWVVQNGHAHFAAIDKLAVNETEMAIAEGDIDTAVIVPDKHKKSLSEGMRIYQ
jgi:multidrug efflux pump subunit AcrA (membrane-fusion protein)